jgi:hypothetical protein
MKTGVGYTIPLLFYFFYSINMNAQNEKNFNAYPGAIVSVMAEDYDGSVLIQVNPVDLSKPVFLIKYSLEGKEIWKKQFDNMDWITGVKPCSDSGFIMTAAIISNPKDSPLFNSIDVSLMKYDKCAHLQWAKYIPASGYNVSMNVIEINKNYYFTADINPPYSNFSNRIDLLKFNTSGTFIKKISFPGVNAILYFNKNPDTIYIAQHFYIPIDKDTSLGYVFTGLEVVDTNLNILKRNVIGYKKLYNGLGPIIVKNNKIIAFTGAADFDNRRTLITEWNKGLDQLGGYIYDSVKNFDLYPFFADSANSNSIVYSQVVNHANDSLYVSIRLYDKTYKLIKEAVINKNFRQVAYSWLHLKNGNSIASMYSVDPFSSNITTSSFFLYDKQLNPLAWPTVPPVKGYDWACTSNIPPFEIINPDSVAKPVHVPLDTSKADWRWLGIEEPKHEITGQEENGWLAWPQPATKGEALHLRMERPVVPYLLNQFAVQFYDQQGKETGSAMAIRESNNQWVIPSLALQAPGLYLAVLVNKRTGTLLGEVKVTVK